MPPLSAHKPSLIPPTFQYPLKLCFATTLTTWVLSLITGNVSQVDRLWTFLPTIYTAYWALLPLWPNENKSIGYLAPYVPERVVGEVVEAFHPRAVLMLALTFLWMCRLSYNTWRRGLFRLDDEDYRWVILRTKIPPWLFQLTNLTFIAGIQNFLLLLLAFPTHRALSTPRELTTTDYILTAVSLTLLTIEFTADNQQFAYQTFKHADPALGEYDGKAVEWPGARLKWTEADRRRGFCTKGLWAWSRHPNFWCEQTFWGVITLFPLLSSPTGALEYPEVTTLSDALQLLAPLAPSLALCALFVSSTYFTESISMSKYPEAYGAYRKRVSMFAPSLTPMWGILLKLTGGKEQVEELVWGQKLELKGSKDE